MLLRLLLAAAALAGGASAFSAPLPHTFSQAALATKPALGTFLKFWSMGGEVGDGWKGSGELDFRHTSGARCSVVIEPQAVRVVTPEVPSLPASLKLCLFCHALFDELTDLASTTEADPEERLAYPPSAIDDARAALPAQREL